MGKSKNSFYLILILVFLQFFLFGCKKTEPKKNIDDKGQNYIDYSKKKNEFENNNFVKRDIKDIFDIKIMDELMIENTMNEKYFLKKTAQSDLLFSAFSNILNNTIKNQIIYYRLDICSSEFEDFKKYDIGKYKNLISKIENKYEIPSDKYFIEGRENLGLLENVKDGKSYLEIDNKNLSHNKNILPQNDKIFYYTLIGGKIKYAFIFKDTNIFNIKDENMLLNNYDAFEKPNSLKFNLGYIEKDIIVNSVDESLKNSEEIKIPYYVSIIGEGVFKNFTNLKKIDLTNICEIKKEAFKDTKLEKINLPNLLKLGEMGFSDCKYLTSINFPKLENLESYAFNNCERLNNINLENILEIGDFAFAGCKSLEKISMTKVKKIGDHSFSNATGLKEVIMDNVEIISNDAFSNCKSLEKVSMIKVKKIGSYSFHGCISLTKINLDNILEIATFSFGDCTALNTVLNIDKVKKIGSNAFYGCSSLEKIDLKNVEEFDDNSFASCTSLDDINLENAKKIGNYAFSKCNFSNVDLKNVEEVGKGAFSSCKNLVHINLRGLKRLSQYIFGDCVKLSNISLDNVDVIDSFAFAGCDSLTEIDLKNVKEIGQIIFSRCYELQRILINGSMNGQNENFSVEDGKRVYRKSDNQKIIDLD